MLAGKAICSTVSAATHRPVAILVDRPGLGEVTEHLAHEERVAVGLALHRMGETHGGVVEGVPGGGFHERS